MEEGWLSGYIQDYDGQALTLIVPFSDSEYIKTHSVTECSVRVEDGRRISAVKTQSLRSYPRYCRLDGLRAAGAERIDEVRFYIPAGGRNTIL